MIYHWLTNLHTACAIQLANLVKFRHESYRGVSPNNNVDWASRKQFSKPNSIKVWADFDNPSDYAKLCMSPSLDGTLPEYVISQEDNSPLILYIDFHNFFFLGPINSPFDQVHS